MPTAWAAVEVVVKFDGETGIWPPEWLRALRRARALL